MSLLSHATVAFERFPLPDAISRAVIGLLVARTDRALSCDRRADVARFADDMAKYPIAEHADLANEQHYELPARFFELMLGPARKYSCCFYTHAEATLADAEEAALRLTAEHAALADGQSILELGCGWGSLSLWMARRFPNARITAVSNAAAQRLSIEARARAEGFDNLTVVTADMNIFATPERFDRIVSVEMFEHMANWRALLTRARSWLKPDGCAFIHVFTHAHAPYRFLRDNEDDWIARHFFSGGIMPSHDLMAQFPDLFTVEQSWRWNGRHYRHTALDWLARYDAAHDEIGQILHDVYADDAALWRRRWRLFLLATAGLFGHRKGRAWGVSHYRLRPSA
jgi:cyclopropane-fatty-acyl-phospholipid synthase